MTLAKAMEKVNVRAFWVFRQGLSCMANLRGRPAVKDIVLPPVIVIIIVRDIAAQDVVVAALLLGHL
jgi:hypothetical protein